VPQESDFNPETPGGADIDTHGIKFEIGKRTDLKIVYVCEDKNERVAEYLSEVSQKIF